MTTKLSTMFLDGLSRHGNTFQLLEPSTFRTWPAISWSELIRHHLVMNRFYQLIQRGMPLNLFLVRHGESEGNVFFEERRAGNIDDNLAREFSQRHGCDYRLTTRGRNQVAAAGRWLMQNSEPAWLAPAHRFHRLITSTHLRAKETAGVISLEMNALDEQWYFEPLLRERDYGPHEYATDLNLSAWSYEYQQVLERPLHHTVPGMETPTGLLSRLWIVLSILCQECSMANVLIVCHSEVIWYFRYLLERMSDRAFASLHRDPNNDDKLANGGIVQYSRRDPETGAIGPYFTHVRVVDPCLEESASEEASNNPTRWRKILRKQYNAEALLKEAEEISVIIDPIH